MRLNILKEKRIKCQFFLNENSKNIEKQKEMTEMLNRILFQ